MWQPSPNEAHKYQFDRARDIWNEEGLIVYNQRSSFLGLYFGGEPAVSVIRHEDMIPVLGRIPEREGGTMKEGLVIDLDNLSAYERATLKEKGLL